MRVIKRAGIILTKEMLEIRLTKNCEWGNKNKILRVTNNVAHSILDAGCGNIVEPEEEKKEPKKTKVYKDRMMSSESSSVRVKKEKDE